MSGELTLAFDAASLAFIGKLGGIGSLLAPGIGAGVLGVAQAVAEQAQTNTETAFQNPTGNLSENITAQQVDNFNATVIVDVPYAWRMEEGFAGTDSLGRKYDQAAEPYLRPAADAVGGGSALSILGGAILSSIGGLFGA